MGTPLCRTMGTSDCVKIGLPADAKKPTSFLMQMKAELLIEYGLPGEAGPSEEGGAAESCINVRAEPTAAPAVTLAGLTVEYFPFPGIPMAG